MVSWITSSKSLVVHVYNIAGWVNRTSSSGISQTFRSIQIMLVLTLWEPVSRSAADHQRLQFSLRNLIARAQRCQASTSSCRARATGYRWWSGDLSQVRRHFIAMNSFVSNRYAFIPGKYICEGDGITRNIKTPTPPSASPSPYSRPG